MREIELVKTVERLEDAGSLDPLVEKVRTAVNALVQPQGLRDVLHGVPIGHPMHPLLVLAPIGTWVSAGLLDAVPGTARAARLLVAAGLVSAAPTAAAGLTDWSRLRPQQARVGIVHAAANVVAVGLYTASWLQRRRGRELSGKILAYLGLGVISGSGFLGGHLSYRQAAGANHAEGIPSRFPQGWQSLGVLTSMPQNELITRDVAGHQVLVLRRGSSVDVLSAVCTHLSGPLGEGELLGGETDDPCVKCPWHGSVFSITTGEVVHGPATAPEHRFESRVVDGTVEVRLPGAG
jgi:nitrite reductase/ring-hydroxylating ferredoxin subunit/uncharacterized membrane protein